MPRLHHVFALAFAAGTAGVASAQTNYDWNNASGGSFNLSTNWTPLGPPSTTNDIARFPVAATYGVTFTNNVTILRHVVSQGNVTWYLNGWTFQNTDTVSNGVGNNVTPTSLRVVNGNFQPGNFTVGGTAGVVSSAEFDQVLITTIGSGVFFVGTSGTGDLLIKGGSTVTTTGGSAGIGLNASGVGTVTVTGSGSALTIPNTYRVASAGHGTLTIQSGATGTVGALEIGETSGGVGLLTVTGANSTLTSNGTTNIAGSSNLFPAASGTLTVGPGATVNLNGTTNLRTTATVNVNGGTLNLATVTATPGAAVNFNSGKINFANGSSIDTAMLDLLLAGSHTLGTSRILSASAGTMTLGTGLAVNGGSLQVADLNVAAPLGIGVFGTVSASGMVDVAAGSAIQVDDFGTLAAGTAILNSGLIEAKGSLATITGFTQNLGVVQGTGRFAGGMNIGTTGTLRARAGDHLVIEQVGLTNSGAIELSGGTVEYTKTLSNLASGFITGRGEFRGGTSTPGSNGVSNLGVMAFSGGTTDIHGDVLNTATGKIIASGASVVTFYDDVTHNGAEIRTNADSRSVFFGSLSGAGPFTGGGVVEINGDLRPGNSPAIVTFGGDVEMSSTAELLIELAGTIAGSEYDRVSVASRLYLDGTLDVTLLGGFSPATGDSFDVLDFNALIGSFSQVNLPALSGNLSWDTSNLYTTGTLMIVPEPAMLSPLLLAGLAIARRRR